jgi:methylase of polypeptide subunit release factors
VRFPGGAGGAWTRARRPGSGPGNAARHGVSERIEFVAGDFSVLCGRRERFGLIVANPPYGARPNTWALPEVAAFERDRPWFRIPTPRAGHGVRMLPTLAPGGGECLSPGGVFLMEMGHAQAGRRKRPSPDSPCRGAQGSGGLDGCLTVYI